MYLTVKQGFSPSAHGHGELETAVGACPVHGGMLTGIPRLHPLDVGNNPPLVMTTQKMSPDVPGVGVGGGQSTLG